MKCYRVALYGFGLLLLSALVCGSASAQFIDRFDDLSLEGWTFFTGDGEATMDFRPSNGHASILVDATQDQRNVWWALVKREVSEALDLSRVREPGTELRIEARIRVSHAPRRVNLHLNTQKTVDFHTHLMEFDIPDTLSWHTISMTTRHFEAEPGDIVNGQLALMDWGGAAYRVDIDYFKVDVVDAANAEPDRGAQVPYHPPVPDPATFAQRIDAAQDGMIDLHHPDANFNRWYVADDAGKTPVLTVDGTRYVVMRWDLQAYAGRQVAGHGLLALTTHSVQRTASDREAFGKVRVAEILGGDPAWDRATVTLNSLCQGKPLDAVVNTQMIIDVDVTEAQGRTTLITISRPVLQRLLDGKTRGLLLRPLGAINATFYAMEHAGGAYGPRLYFTLEPE